MLSLTHRFALPFVLLALPACAVPEVVGNNPDDTNGAATTGDTTSDTPGTTGTTVLEPTATVPTDPGEGVTTGPGVPETVTTGSFETATTQDTEAAGDTDTGGSDAADFMAMEACDIADVCPPWTQNFAESEPYGNEPERLCVWEGLGAGTVGRYRYVSAHQFTNGSDDSTVIMHVHAERKVTFAYHDVGSYMDENMETVEYDNYGPAKTCTLAAPELFEPCPTVEPFEVTDCYWLAQGTPWFTDCVAEGPKCE